MRAHQLTLLGVLATYPCLVGPRLHGGDSPNPMQIVHPSFLWVLEGLWNEGAQTFSRSCNAHPMLRTPFPTFSQSPQVKGGRQHTSYAVPSIWNVMLGMGG